MTLYLVVVLTVLVHTAFAGTRVAVSLFALQLGASPLTVGVLIALYAFFPMLFSVSIGRLVDRIGFRRPMLFAAATTAGGSALAFIWPSLTALFWLSTLVGMGMMVHHIAVSHMVGMLGSPENRARNFSLLALGFSTSGFIGPTLAGFAIDSIGYRDTFALMALFPLLGLALLTWGKMDLPRPRGDMARAGDRRLIDLVRMPSLRAVLIVSALLSTAWDLFTFVVPIYGARIGLSASTIGTLFGAFSGATFLVRLVLPAVANRLPEWKLLAAALFIACGTYFLFPLMSNVSALMTLAFVLGIGLGASQPMVMSLLYTTAPPERVGEAVGVRTTLVNVSQTVMPLMFGMLGAVLGMVPVFWTLAVCLAGGGWFSARRR